MRLLLPSALLLACAAVTSADQKFNSSALDTSSMSSGSQHNSTKKAKKPKSAAEFGNNGGKMLLCPSGDCTSGQVLEVKMARLEEFDATGKSVNNKAETFASADFAWTALTPTVLNGANTLTTTYVSMLDVGPGGKSGTVDFNITASIYEQAGNATNGNVTLPVPLGGLKFTVSMAKWPFKNTTNHVRFGVTIHAKGKDGKGKDKATKAARNGTKGVDRLDLSEGMFMDAPDVAILDGQNVLINSSVELEGGKMEMIWDFPHFTETCVYDPALGSEDPSALVEGDDDDAAGEASGSGTTKTTIAPTPAPTSSATTVLGWTTTIIAALSAIAYIAA